jgi:type IV pilus assembly protein PilA
MNQNKAFSLIELMVVIAILAILAAVAVPYYKHYVSQAQIGAAVPRIDNILESQILLSQSKPYLQPTLADLNLTHDASLGASFFDTDYLQMGADDAQVSSGVDGNGCVTSGTVAIGYNNLNAATNAFLGALVNDPTASLILNAAWVNNNGVIQKLYSYNLFYGGITAETNEIIGGWVNELSPAGSTTLTNFYLNATCSG